MKKVRLYIGCALTHAPQEYKDQIFLFRNYFKDIEWIEVLEFLGQLQVGQDKENFPLDVYTNDIHGCVGTAHAIIGELSFPSTGLGWELATAVEKHTIRTMMCAQKRNIVSNLPIGASIHKYNECATFHFYEKSIMELLPYFLEELKVLHEA